LEFFFLNGKSLAIFDSQIAIFQRVRLKEIEVNFVNMDDKIGQKFTQLTGQMWELFWTVESGKFVL